MEVFVYFYIVRWTRSYRRRQGCDLAKAKVSWSQSVGIASRWNQFFPIILAHHYNLSSNLFVREKCKKTSNLSTTRQTTSTSWSRSLRLESPKYCSVICLYCFPSLAKVTNKVMFYICFQYISIRNWVQLLLNNNNDSRSWKHKCKIFH